MSARDGLRWWQRPRPHFLPPVPVAVPAMLGAGLLVSLAFEATRSTPNSDFSEYYAAALLALKQGWAAPYHPALHMAELHSLGLPPDAFATSPVVIWLAVPFTALPLPVAYRVWLVLLLVVLLLAWRLAAPGAGTDRAWQVLGGLGLFPVYYALWEGQVAVVVAALFVLHWWLVHRGNHLLAGVVLAAAAVIKPQMVFLLPFALLLSGRWKVAASFAVTFAVLAGVCAAALGLDGLQAYRYSVGFELGRDWITRHTLSRYLPGGAPLFVVRALITVAALLPALFDGARRYERAAAAAVLGGLLLTPYLNVQDLTILVPCAWLVWRTRLPAWSGPAMALSYLVVALDPAFFLRQGALPVLAVELVWLAVLAAWAVRPPRETAMSARLQSTGPPLARPG